MILNDYLLAVILGIIEGLTEFLPVSSTAHLRIFEAWAGISMTDRYWIMFTIVIQLGAILSLPIYFRKTLWEFLTHFPRGTRGDRTIFTHPLTLIGVAFVFTAVPALLLSKVIGENLESIYVMGVSLIVGGVVMWVIDRVYADDRNQRTQHIEDVGPFQAIWVGLCQVLAATFPGVSRSMATIASGQLGGMTRSVALEFSFLLSIPTMAAATGYDLLKALRPSEANMAGVDGTGSRLATSIDSHGAVLLIIGGFVSFVVAYVVVAWFMRWVRQHGFVPFAIYRLVLGTLVLLFASHLTG